MTERKELGRIKKVYCGLTDAQLGISFELGGSDGWGVMTQFRGHWGGKRSEYAKWTDEDRIRVLGETFMYIGQLLSDAKVRDVSELVGKPVEATFDGNLLTDWRILKEVL